MQGKVILIPTTLGDSPIENVIPEIIKKTIIATDYYIVENIRTARRYISALKTGKVIDDITFYVLNKHTSPDDIASFLAPITKGFDIGVISEAGVPGVADPGADVVALAHTKNIKVIPLTGPSSIIMSLMSSGLNGQNFAFVGYLPAKQGERIKRLKELERRSSVEKQTQMFIETPFRNNHLVEDLVKICAASTKLCIAADITLETEFIETKTVKDWKGKIPNLHKRPAIFLIQG